MLISYNWLKEITDFSLDINELSDVLTMLGIEVESWTDNNNKYDNFYVAKILKHEKHPNADKLSVCTVLSNNRELQIVCGAPNADAGQMVVLGTKGAVIPESGITIEERKLRGVPSEGMLCSEFELQIGNDKSGILILPDDAPQDSKLADYLKLNDIILDIGITPNRADCLSHIGIAREIAAYSNGKISKQDAIIKESDNDINNNIKIKIEDSKRCPRYMARIIRNIQNNKSPLWLKTLIYKLGLRPVNLAVDVTNYVMYESGQPLHAFDLNYINNNSIIVKTAIQNEEFITLDSKKHKLDAEMLMICDDTGPIAIGGVMGGENSEIKNDTKDILIESAYFNPSSIRRTAKKLGIQSDASYRFERGIDIENLEYALNRAVSLIAQYSGCTVDKGIIDIYPVKKERPVCTVRFNRTEKIIGIKIESEKIISILERLDFVILHEDNKSVTVEVPPYRVDISEEIDVIEEIARLYNYDNIKPQFTSSIDFHLGKLDAELEVPKLKDDIRHYLVPQGFNEIITQTQTDPTTSKLFAEDLVQIANPLGEEISIMRPSLVPAMLRVIERNIRHGSPDLKLFEIGKTFHKVDASVKSYLPNILENEELIIALTGQRSPLNWSVKKNDTDFYDILGLFENLIYNFRFDFLKYIINDEEDVVFSKNSLKIIYEDKKIGMLGEAKQSLLKKFNIDAKIFLLDLELNDIYYHQRKKATYSKVTPYPVVKRDLAFVVNDDIFAESLMTDIKNSAGDLLQDIDIFDVYKGSSIGEGKKSIAFSLVYSSLERTLTEEEIDASINNIIKNIEAKFLAILRKF